MKKICECRYSKSNNSYSFFPKDISNSGENWLEEDAILLHSIEASSRKEANQKLNWLLWWEETVDEEYYEQLEKLFWERPFSDNSEQ